VPETCAWFEFLDTTGLSSPNLLVVCRSPELIQNTGLSRELARLSAFLLSEVGNTRTLRRFVRKASPHSRRTKSRLANPIRKQICTPAQINHAGKPANRTNRKSAMAYVLPTIARLSLSQYQRGPDAGERRERGNHLRGCPFIRLVREFKKRERGGAQESPPN
jgi:hypothetical protein